MKSNAERQKAWRERNAVTKMAQNVTKTANNVTESAHNVTENVTKMGENVTENVTKQVSNVTKSVTKPEETVTKTVTKPAPAVTENVVKKQVSKPHDHICPECWRIWSCSYVSDEGTCWREDLCLSCENKGGSECDRLLAPIAESIKPGSTWQEHSRHTLWQAARKLYGTLTAENWPFITAQAHPDWPWDCVHIYQLCPHGLRYCRPCGTTVEQPQYTADQWAAAYDVIQVAKAAAKERERANSSS